MSKVVLFACPHGAAKSRIAAAFFNQRALPGWTAISVGLEPQAELGFTASRLLAGSAAEDWLDREPPRPIEAVPNPTLVVAIDCQLENAEIWLLSNREFNEELRNELETSVGALTERLAH